MPFPPAIAHALAQARLQPAELERLSGMHFQDAGHGYDAFGLHPSFVELGAVIAGPVYDRYFRVKSSGHEHIPDRGPAILVANHSGNIPIDGMMMWMDVLRHTNPPRVARAVADHFVPSLPFVGTLFARSGMVGGSRGNARALLEAGELLMIFPEGTPGIVKPFSERYQLRHFRVGHAEMAIRHGAPVVPCAVVGAEEQMPQLTTSKRLGKPFGIPEVPIPAVPIPLPVRYHLLWGPPIPMHRDYTPDQADDPKVVREAAARVQDAVQALIDRGLKQRKGIFQVKGPVNVLVTGADAPVGERLVRDLLDDSRVDRILAVPWREAQHLPRDERLTVVPVDMSSSRKVHELLFGVARDLAIDVVVHTQLHRSAHDEGSRVHRYNVDAVRSLLDLCERHPTIRRFIVRSAAAVYQIQRDLPVLIGEHHPLNMTGNAPQWVRDRVEADVTACTRMGMTPLQIVVLRTAEVLAPGTGSQLYDYLESTVCLRPAGYDPMLNVLTIKDCSAAMQKALHHDAQGVFNIPGADTLPLTAAIRSWGRIGIPVLGAVIAPAYRLRSRVTGRDFRYGMNRRRFHYSGVLDGTRARDVLGYVPCHPVAWPTT